MTRHVAVAAVLAVLSACGSGADAPPARTFSAQGGTGTFGMGGKGGMLQLISAGGDVLLEPAGAMPAPTPWRVPSLSLGVNPRTITADTVLIAADPIVGDAGYAPATGIEVAAGATLTLESPGPTFNLALAGALVVRGTVRVGLVPGTSSPARLSGEVGSLAILPGGRVIATGAPGDATTAGGAGGIIDLMVLAGFSNQGTFELSGGDGATGGQGGVLVIQTRGGSRSTTGTVTARGGVGLDGVGGRGGNVYFPPPEPPDLRCDARLGGRLALGGGHGTAGSGDASGFGTSGGTVMAGPCPFGDLDLNADIDVSGGDATVKGSGGTGGQVSLIGGQGQVRVAGRITGRGGTALGGLGGRGGSLAVFGTIFIPTSPAGVASHVWLGADLRLDGGAGDAGGEGGAGGSVLILTSVSQGGDRGITLVGYPAIALTGGRGALGGAGGLVMARSEAQGLAGSTRIGAIQVGSAIDASAGDASAGAGGSCDVSVLGTPVDPASNADLPSATRRVTLRAPFRAVGGAGTTTGGQGGTLLLEDLLGVSAEAPVTLSGGPGGSDRGGDGGQLRVSSSAAVRLGAVTADGGPSTSASGGGGGDVVILSSAAALTRTGTLSVRGGAGGAGGTTGNVVVGGALQTLTDGQLRP